MTGSTCSVLTVAEQGSPAIHHIHHHWEGTKYFPCMQASRTAATLKVHDAAVTVLHTVRQQHADDVSAHLLVTGSADSCLSIWTVQQTAAGAAIEHVEQLSPSQARSAQDAAADTASRSVPQGPITGLASWQSKSCCNGEPGVLLAAVSGDGCIHLWQGSTQQGSQTGWRKQQTVQVHRQIIQHCIAFSHLPGQPDQCAHPLCPPYNDLIIDVACLPPFEYVACLELLHWAWCIAGAWQAE